MPCFTTIATVLIDLKSIESAAAALKIELVKRNANRFTLRKGGDSIEIERSREGEKFNALPAYSSGNYPDNILTPLTMAYAKTQLKTFAQKRGYTLSAGSKAGEYVLTQYGG